MDDLWYKIAAAVAVVLMIAFVFPRAKIMYEESRAAPKDWPAVLVPIALVIAFVLLLIQFVR
jgi:hypothetical protein